MKRLLVVLLLAIPLAGSTGCNRSWGSFWNRGAECNTYETCPSPCGSAPIIQGTLLPPSTSGSTVMPGPAETLPSP